MTNSIRQRPLRIAYFSPLPPERSGISDYSAELLPYLARSAQITLYAAQPDLVADGLRAEFEVRPVAGYVAACWQHDIALYQMGDSMFHDAMYPVLLRRPGITVLHDYELHHFIATRTIPRGEFASYAREMGYALGVEGVELAYRIQQGQAQHPFFTIPLSDRVLDRSLGVIVHSRYALQRIAELRPNLPVMVVPAPIRTDLGHTRSRREIGCSEDAFIIVSAGQVITIKQITLALEAFARLRVDFPNARFVVVGDELKHDLDLERWLQQRGLEESVVVTGYLPDMQDFVSWIAAADVMVNLRYPTVGETSATALRGLAAGRPVIVSDHGWYAELPDDVCVKVTPNDEDALYQAMRRLAESAELRRTIGQCAAVYVRQEHSLAAAAGKYLDFIGEIMARVAGQLTRKVLRRDGRLVSGGAYV